MAVCCAEKLLVEDTRDAKVRKQALYLACPSSLILNGALVHFYKSPFSPQDQVSKKGR
jgi:hypothetical protein